MLALVLSAVPWLARSSTVQRVIREGQDATGQTTLRWAVVLLFVLLAVASRFGLDVVLGAMLAGMVLRGWTRRLNIDTASLEHKFDAVGYGIFIPIFFISSGMTLDLKAISQDPLRLLIFFVLLLIVRGLPSLLVYRRALPPRQRVEMTFITATTLPLLIALADIGEQDGVMLPATSAALVGAGVLSVLVYPLIAVGLHRSAPLTPADAGIAAAPTATSSSPPPEDPGQPGQTARTGTERSHASRVIIRHAPMTDQPTIQPTITAIIAHVGIGGMPRAPRPPNSGPAGATMACGARRQRGRAKLVHGDADVQPLTVDEIGERWRPGPGSR